MATLEKLRSKAGCLIAAVGLGMVAFILGDLVTGGSALWRDSKMTAFSVNGNKVRIEDYQQHVNAMNEQMRAQGQSLNSDQTVQLNNQIFGTIVSNMVLHDEADKIGLSITPAETFDLIQGQNISPIIRQQFTDPNTGEFNRAQLLTFLKQLNTKENYSPEQQSQIDQMRSMWAETETQVRDLRLQEKYLGLLSKAIVANKLEVARETEYNKTVQNLTYVGRRTIALPDSAVTVADAEIKDYYNAHKDYFRTDAGAHVDVIYASIDPSEADYQAAEEDIRSAREELIAGKDPALVLSDYSDIPYADTYITSEDINTPSMPTEIVNFITTAETGSVSEIIPQDKNYLVAKIISRKQAPESLLVSHIVLSPAGTPNAPEVNADSLLATLKAAPETFATAAQTYSLDRNSSAQGGQIGWLTEAMATNYIGKDFAEAIYSAQVGAPFSFTSKYGRHIILVSEAKPVVDKFKVALAAKEVTASTETQTQIYNNLSSFLTSSKDKDLTQEALNAGYQVLKDQLISSSQPSIAPGISNSRDIVTWSMQNKEGTISPIKEADEKYVVTRVGKKFSEGFMPIEVVKEQISALLANQKKADLLYDQMMSADHSSLEAYASAIGSSVDSLSFVKYSTTRLEGLGVEPGINAAAAVAALNTATPVKGLNGVYLVNVLSREADTQASDATTIKTSLERSLQGMIRATALQTVISKAKISDNRYNFF